MSEARASKTPSSWLVVAAFAAVYLIWGSTYLAIRFAVETIPPFLMAGARFLTAGTVLYSWTRLTGTPKPDRSHWPAAALIGGLLLLGGNGLLSWSEKHVPSGLASLIIATIPLWMVLLGWLWRGGVRPTMGVAIGILLGSVGIFLLMDPTALSGGAEVSPLNAAVLLLAAICWSVGSIYSRTARLPDSPLLATAMELLAGGAMLVVVGLGAGEWAAFDVQAVTPKSILSLAYLSVFGSIVAFTAYVWLLRVSTPARVATYAYVNPVVALYLGWALADEPVTARTLLASAIILGAVVIITTRGAARVTAPAPGRAAEQAGEPDVA